MFATIVYFVFTVVGGKEFSINILCLSAMIDMANCTVLVFIHGMMRSSTADCKAKVVKELNRGKTDRITGESK